MRHVTTDEMLDVVRAWAATHYAAKLPKRLRLYFVSEDPEDFVALPMPTRATATEAEPEEEEAGEPFVPTVFQSAILDALAGKAMRADGLGAAVGDRSRLWKPGGLKELQAEGLIAHHKRLGYYRPDDPPPEIAAEQG